MPACRREADTRLNDRPGEGERDVQESVWIGGVGVVQAAVAARNVRGYRGFVTEQGDAAYSISIFDDRNTAIEAHQRVRKYIVANMRDLMPAEPQVTAGETVFHEVAQPQEQHRDSQQPLFVVIRIYTGLPGQPETMHSLVSQHTLPAIMNAPGFRGFYACRDEEDTNRAISVTLFETRGEAMRTHEQVVQIMREQLGELAYRVPKV